MIINDLQTVGCLSFLSKIHFETFSQLEGMDVQAIEVVYHSYQRYILKPFHNGGAMTLITDSVVYHSYQRYILKPFHNQFEDAPKSTRVVYHSYQRYILKPFHN